MKNIMMLASFLGLAASLAVACSASDGAAPTADNPDAGTVAPGGSALPCDVDAVLAKNCRQCHSSPPSFGAPMPLLTLADLRGEAKSGGGKKVFERVGVRIHDDAAPMPQAPNPRLSPADTATLDT